MGTIIAGMLYLSFFCVMVCNLAGCAPRTAAQPAKRVQGIYHVVRPGENLYRIGKAYDVGYEELARLNRLRAAGQIRVGQQIFIPGATRELPVEIVTPAETAPKMSSIPQTAPQTPFVAIFRPDVHLAHQRHDQLRVRPPRRELSRRH